MIKLTVVARKRLICLGTFQKVAAFELTAGKTLQVGPEKLTFYLPLPHQAKEEFIVKLFILRPNKVFLFFGDFRNVKAKMGDLHLTYYYYYMSIYI